MPQFKKILCAMDFDQNSLQALRLASELAQEREAKLYLLHIVPTPPGPEVPLRFDKMEAAARIRLERLARQKVNGKASYKVEFGMGDPGVEILLAAKRWGSQPDRNGDPRSEGTPSVGSWERSGTGHSGSVVSGAHIQTENPRVKIITAA